MGYEKEKIPPLTLIFRYLTLSVMTLVLTAMVIASFWMVHSFVNFVYLEPGISAGSLSLGYQDIFLIREKGAIVVTGVDSGSAAEKAGIQVGDSIIAVNGVRLKEKPQAYFRPLLRAGTGKEIKFELIRNGVKEWRVVVLEEREPGEITVTAQGFPIKGSVRKVWWSVYLPLILLPALFLIIGAPIGWLRPRDPIAFECSFLFLCISGIFSSLLLDMLPFVASWPYWVLGMAFCITIISSNLAFPLTLRVLSVFPNPSRLGKVFLKWQWVAWLLLGLNSVSLCADQLTQLYNWKKTWLITNPVTQFFINTPNILEALFFLTIVVLLVSLLIAQRIETRQKPQTRLKMIEFGVLLALLGIIVLSFMAKSSIMRAIPESWRPVWGLLTIVIFLIPFSALPLSFAYTILTRKVFGIRFIIRKGLQHLLLSKGALLLEGVIIFFIVLQVIRQGGTRLASSMTAVSGIAVGSSFLVMVGLSRINRKIMPAIDRRFFRETLDVRRLLLDLSEQLSEFRESEKILKRTASTVLKALHPFRVVLLLKEAQTKDIKCVLDLKNGTSRLASIEELEKEAVSNPSLELKSEDLVIQQLEQKKPWLDVYPEKLNSELEEEKRLLELNCELLIALQGSSGLLGVMGLGAKLSEEPFSGEDRELLLTVARQMGMALENAELLEVAKREAELSRDLEIAKQVQQNLFPKKLPSVTGWEFAGICRSARAVGGDYYDIFEVAPGKVLLALGDVSGKGLGASLLMASVHSAIRSRAVTSIDDPSKLIVELNHHLLSSTSPETFVTLFLGLIDLETGKLQYVNCGHPAPILLCQEGKKQERLTIGGPILGILDGVPYTKGEHYFRNGDILVLFSDGVTEATNQQEEMFEEERLLQVLSAKAISEASAILDMIFKSVDSFATGCEQADDISAVVIHRL